MLPANLEQFFASQEWKMVLAAVKKRREDRVLNYLSIDPIANAHKLAGMKGANEEDSWFETELEKELLGTE